ncbi:MAG: cytochrome P450 [Candidatus Binatia bacterium]
MPDHPDHPRRDDIDLLAGEFYKNDPHPAFEWMRTNAPVYWDEKGGVWGITKHADVQLISKDSTTFCNGQGMRPDSDPTASMINMDDPGHKRRRNLVNKGFTPRRVAEKEEELRAITRELIAEVAPKGRCEFVMDVAAWLPMITIGDMLGVEPEDRATLLQWSDDMLLATATDASDATLENAGKAFEGFIVHTQKVIADRRARELTKDLISVLVHSDIDGDRLNEEELIQESLLILIGGDETTRHVITGGLEQLLLNPDQKQKLLDDPSKIPTAVEEMLRWVSPIQNMARTATRDVELRGQRICKGDKLLLLYPSANRDEEIFENSMRFDIERQPNGHLAFGGYGTHFCLGASLARLELKVMFEELLESLPDIELDTEVPAPRRPSNFVVGIETMPVRFAAR